MSDRLEWERDAVVWLAGRAIEAAMDGMTDRAAAGPPDDARLAGAMARFAAWRAEAGREADAPRFSGRGRRPGAAAGRSAPRIDPAPQLGGPGPPGPPAAKFPPAPNPGAAPLAGPG